MTTKQQRDFPRVNFVALLAGALFLVSVFLFWWGIDTTGSIVSESFRWSLWSGPSSVSISGAGSAQMLVTYGPLVGVLVIASAILVLVGTLPKASLLLIGSSLLSIAAPIVYVIIVNDAVTNGCSGTSPCISGPFGTQTFTAGPFTTTLTWGFQTGFYLEIVGAVLSLIAIAFHRTFVSSKSS